MAAEVRGGGGVLGEVAVLRRAMSVMIEVHYARPADSGREAKYVQQILALGGRLQFREESEITGAANTVCLTYEFDDWNSAERAAIAMRGWGEHVEGPVQYGD